MALQGLSCVRTESEVSERYKLDGGDDPFFTVERTFTQRDLDLAVLEARRCALLCVAEKLNHVADGYLKSGHSHRAHMLNALVAEILSSQFMQRVADLQKRKAAK